jgi:enoyl-CoA hydratase
MALYSSFEHIKVEIEGGIATVILNRPEVLNAINERLHKELGDIWLTLDADADVEVIILTGAGRAFCAGGDINMLEIHKPVVAAVNGAAMGMGSTLALLCDVAVMADDARIGDTHVPAGLVAGDGGTVLWPMLIGPMKAKEYLMTGQFLTGTQAAEMGLVNHACPREELLAKANELAARFLAQPRWAMRWTKMAVNKLIKDQVNLVLDTSMSLELVTLFTNDHKEAVRAFIDKRAPKFVGS